MSDKVKGAVDTYLDTEFNCAQSVLAAFAPQLGMDRNTAMRVACGFGSGMGKSGNMCGAVTGGMLVLGLKYGMVDPDATQDKDKTYEAVRQLLEKIGALHGSVNCTDLMGLDIGTPEGQQEAKEKDLSEKICSKVVGDVVKVLENILN